MSFEDGATRTYQLEQKERTFDEFVRMYEGLKKEKDK